MKPSGKIAIVTAIALGLAGCTTTQPAVNAAGTAVGGIATTGQAGAITGVEGLPAGATLLQGVPSEPGNCYYRLADQSLYKAACPPGYTGV